MREPRIVSMSRGLALPGCVVVMCTAGTLSAQPYFVGTGTLDGFGVSAATGISYDGTVAVGESSVIGPPKAAFRWTRSGGMSSLTPGQHSSCVGGVNGDGDIIAGLFVYSGTVEAFRWTLENGAIALGDLPGGEFRSSAISVSARGDILVGYSNSARGNEAIRWTAEAGMVGLGDLPGGVFRSTALAISADGRVIVGAGWSDQGNEAYRWTTDDGMVGLGDLAGGPFDSAAWAVSADGSVVVGDSFDAEAQRAFRWTAETGLQRLTGSFEDERFSHAFGIAWDGSVIVGEVALGSRQGGAYYWTADDGVRLLADVLDEHGVIVPDGWHLDRANAVSADGRTIVGYGVNPQGFTEGWVAYIGPACRADYDKSGSVNADDVAAYLAAWSARSVFTDWNYDGYIDTRDVIGFLRAWAAGC